jgi:hypothetical protein
MEMSEKNSLVRKNFFLIPTQPPVFLFNFFLSQEKEGDKNFSFQSFCERENKISSYQFVSVSY